MSAIELLVSLPLAALGFLGFYAAIRWSKTITFKNKEWLGVALMIAVLVFVALAEEIFRGLVS